ncbi:MAG: toll/interleukin-1 receptor domain-containing protein [Vicinamibacterales bacterium]
MGTDTERAADVFVSYSREDLDFARRVQRECQAAGVQPWVDIDGLFAGERFWPEICRAIDSAAAFVFVITPESLQSEFCRRELDWAVMRQKRIVPVCRRHVDDAAVPPPLAERQWVFFRPQDDASHAQAQLLQAVRADWAWLREHARLTVRIEEWEAKSRDTSLLLRGRELRRAEEFLAGPPPPNSRVASGQREFVRLSRMAARKRRLILAGSSALAVMLIGAASWTAFVRQLDLNNADARTNASEERIAALARAERICAWLPVSLKACDEVTINLGVADLGGLRYEEGLQRLSSFIDGSAGPALDDDDLRLVAVAHQSRAYSLIMQAAAEAEPSVRRRQYEQAQADVDDATRLYDRVAPSPDDPPLTITQARIDIGRGEWLKALDDLDRAAMRSLDVTIPLLRSLAAHCLSKRPQQEHYRDDSRRWLQEYMNHLPDGVKDPHWIENREYYARMGAQC